MGDYAAQEQHRLPPAAEAELAEHRQWHPVPAADEDWHPCVDWLLRFKQPQLERRFARFHNQALMAMDRIVFPVFIIVLLLLIKREDGPYQGSLQFRLLGWAPLALITLTPLALTFHPGTKSW